MNNVKVREGYILITKDGVVDKSSGPNSIEVTKISTRYKVWKSEKALRNFLSRSVKGQIDFEQNNNMNQYRWYGERFTRSKRLLKTATAQKYKEVTTVTTTTEDINIDMKRAYVEPMFIKKLAGDTSVRVYKGKILSKKE